MAVSLPGRKQIVHGFKWLMPGLRVKRWLILVPIGLAPVIGGVALLMRLRMQEYLDLVDRSALDRAHVDIGAPGFYLPVGIGLIALGLALILAALIAVNRSIVSAVSPEHLSELPDVIQRKRILAQGARIVVVGGGTGLSTLLRGLKQYTGNLTAVVTMTDDGGSSGLLQKQLGGILPPGDIRNCLVALADAEPLMQQLFQYRFSTKNDSDGLSGHSFGNLLIAAMADITGDFERAVKETSNILAIRGRVLPSTVESVVLVGEMADGREVTGETNIAHDPAAISKIKLCPDHPQTLPDVLKAIRDADIVVLGPGSVYTSVIPNLIVPELARAIASTRALRCYICNVMTQPGETDGFTASQHVKAIVEHAAPYVSPGQKIVDYVLVNVERPSDDLVSRYESTGSAPVEPDIDAIRAQGFEPVRGRFVSETAVVRHDADALAESLIDLWQKKRR